MYGRKVLCAVLAAVKWVAVSQNKCFTLKFVLKLEPTHHQYLSLFSENVWYLRVTKVTKALTLQIA